jgi:hypothetical protein
LKNIHPSTPVFWCVCVEQKSREEGLDFEHIWRRLIHLQLFNLAGSCVEFTKGIWRWFHHGITVREVSEHLVIWI